MPYPKLPIDPTAEILYNISDESFRFAKIQIFLDINILAIVDNIDFHNHLSIFTIIASSFFSIALTSQQVDNFDFEAKINGIKSICNLIVINIKPIGAVCQ